MDGIPHALSSETQVSPPPAAILMDIEPRDEAAQDLVVTGSHSAPIEQDDEAAASNTPPPPAFALARVSKIIKVRVVAVYAPAEVYAAATLVPGANAGVYPLQADQDVEIVNKEALRAIAVATELFIGHLADQAYTQARLQKRKVVTYKDLNAAVQGSSLTFLDDVVPAPTDLASAFGRRKKQLAEAESLAVGMNGAASSANVSAKASETNGEAVQGRQAQESRPAETSSTTSHAILGKPPGESDDDMSDAD